MTQSDKMMNPEEEERLKKLLSNLPKEDAPTGFEEKLFSNIRRVDNGEDVSLLQKQSNKWLIPSLSIAAGLTIAFLLFNFFDANSSAEQNANQLANQPIETKIDSTREAPISNTQKLNLVNDKK